MNELMGFTFRSKAGLKGYLTSMGAAVGGMFVLYLLVLLILKLDGYITRLDFAMYEHAGAVFAGVFFAITLGRIRRFGVNCGASRRTIMRCTAVAAPVFALATAAMLHIATLLTTAVFSLCGMKLGSCADYFVELFWFTDTDTRYELFGILNFVLAFLLTMFAYTEALIFTAVRDRKGTKAGAAAAGALIFIYALIQYNSTYIPYENDRINYIGFVNDLLDYTAQSTDRNLRVNGESASFILGLLGMTALTVLVFLLVYMIYAKLTKKARICGKEEA